ncbi:hypothetical protein Glove_55g17 [Diversispora epigaea]|uniref:Uncharacterized protein n=1 Tax=Diversispora epigaea TaxID=1348612 RepID=A0A397JGY8_9GLOM|nr:hypothetical protein Glove_55g17 [Diversispora epigaea]
MFKRNNLKYLGLAIATIFCFHWILTIVNPKSSFSRPWGVTELDTTQDDTYIQDQKTINDPNKTKPTQTGKAKAAFVNNIPKYNNNKQIIFSSTFNNNDDLLVTNINECPKLNSRNNNNLPTSVHDLRPDDIKLILALGDSITTAFGADAKCKDDGGDNNYLEELYEYRGVSYAMGGDDGAISLANFYKHYSPELRGASVGNHIVEICYGILCPPKQYHPELDNLNAALTGAMVKNLDYEIDYLLSQYEKESEEFKNSFKFLNLFIGSNDICLICSHSIPWITEKKFERYLMNAIEKIRLNIPNVIINIMDEFNVSQIYNLTKGQTEYCTKLAALPNFECECAFIEGPIGVHNRRQMDELSRKYNEAIKRIVQYYSEQPSNTFAVINHHFEYILTSFPIDSLSCVDCFHPSTKLHQLVAKTLWNSLPFSSLGPKLVNWESDKKIRCWNEQDRIRIR